MLDRVDHRADSSSNNNRMLAIEGEQHIKFSNQQAVNSNSLVAVEQERRSLYHFRALERRSETTDMDE